VTTVIVQGGDGTPPLSTPSSNSQIAAVAGPWVHDRGDEGIKIELDGTAQFVLYDLYDRRQIVLMCTGPVRPDQQRLFFDLRCDAAGGTVPLRGYGSHLQENADGRVVNRS
jgi:hypothetical protein